MKFTILTGILLTTAVALTLALATAKENSFIVINGVIHLVIAGSLAMPFVCRKESLPFWAAYAVTAAFVLLKQGQKTELFHFFLTYLSYFALGEVSDLAPGETIGGFLGLVFHVWSLVWLGAIVGGCFALIHRLSGKKDKQNED